MTTEAITIPAQTMSSLQIAELTGKRHDAILRDIRTLLEQGINAHNFVAVEYLDKKGESRPCYQLTKAGCLILASGYNAVLREKIINRWMELEEAAARQKAVAAENPEQIMARAVLVAQDTINKMQLQLTSAEDKIREDAPKVLFADAVVGSRSTCLVGELAKIISQNGFVIGQNRLFAWLRDNGYLGKHGERRNIPNQQYIEMGLFEVKTTVHDENGHMVAKKTTKVTGKGQQYFINKFLKLIPRP